MTRVGVSLPDLQYHLKKDCNSYKFEFINCFEEFISLEDIFRESPAENIERLKELLLFLASVVDFYKEYVAKFTDRLFSSLLTKYFGMHLEMQSIAQDYLAKQIEDSCSNVSREAVFILRDLFTKNIWADSKTANLLAKACLVRFKKAYLPAIFFFLGKVRTEEDSEDDSDNENLSNKIKHLQTGHRVGNKTNKRKRRLERSIENAKKRDENKIKKNKSQEVNFSALNFIHDPQGFAEGLLKKLEKSSDKFEVKLLLLELISRLIGLFKLCVINFYPALQKFLRPQQREVTYLLMYAAQSSHDQVPPDFIQPMVRTIADNFITERASAEAIAVGLNSVREICARCPYAMEAELLEDLVQYRSYRNKNVVSASRSLIRLYRSLNPNLLPNNLRGKPTDEIMVIKDTNEQTDLSKPNIHYAMDNVVTSVPGAEAIILKEIKSKEKKAQLTAEDFKKLRTEASALTSDLILDDQDFERMKKYLDKQKNSLTARGGQKRKLLNKLEKDRLKQKMEQDDEPPLEEVDMDSSEESESTDSSDELSGNEDSDDDRPKDHPDIVSHSSIVKLAKRPKMDKASRLETVSDGREDREKFGFKVRRMNPDASTTNREKSKKKTFNMIKHKAKSKGKMSIRDKQIRLRNHLMKMAKFTKK